MNTFGLMKDPVVWRMAWKEYRLLRGFWLGLAGLMVFFQLIVLVMPMHEAAENGDRWMMIFAVGITMGALYVLACGATMFATEHEEGTYDFLRALPVKPGQLLAGKLVHAVLGTVVFFVALWLVSALLTSFRFPSASTHLQLWGLWGVAAPELLAWGLLFSLLRRPLTAAVLGVAAASVVVHYVVTFFKPTFQFGAELLPYLHAVPTRLVIVVIVFAADVWLAMRWLRERPVWQWRSQSVADASAVADVSPLVSTAPGYRLPPRGVVLGRLV